MRGRIFTSNACRQSPGIEPNRMKLRRACRYEDDSQSVREQACPRVVAWWLQSDGRIICKPVRPPKRREIPLSDPPSDRPRPRLCKPDERGEGDQHMLIHRAFIFLVVVFLVVVAKPMGEGGIDALDRLAKLASAQGGTSTTRIVGDDQGKALVGGPCP